MAAQTEIPGYVDGTWTIDPVHSSITFSVRHLMVSKVRGSFGSFEGTIVTGARPEDSRVTASVAVESISTGEANRDGHLLSADFFDVESFPSIEFTSTAVKLAGDEAVVEGDFTLHGVTKSVSFEVELGGFSSDGQGGTKLGLEATTKIKRSEFGLNYNAALETGGVLLGDDITITLDVQAALQQ